MGYICSPNLSVLPSMNMLLLLAALPDEFRVYGLGYCLSCIRGSSLSSSNSMTFSSFMVGTVTLSFFLSTFLFCSVTAYVPGPIFILLSSYLSKLLHLSSLSKTADFLTLILFASFSSLLFSNSIFSTWSSYSDSSVLKK
jgi:hypothetical protein